MCMYFPCKCYLYSCVKNNIACTSTFLRALFSHGMYFRSWHDSTYIILSKIKDTQCSKFYQRLDLGVKFPVNFDNFKSKRVLESRILSSSPTEVLASLSSYLFNPEPYSFSVELETFYLTLVDNLQGKDRTF